MWSLAKGVTRRTQVVEDPQQRDGVAALAHAGEEALVLPQAQRQGGTQALGHPHLHIHTHRDSESLSHRPDHAWTARRRCLSIMVVLSSVTISKKNAVMTSRHSSAPSPSPSIGQTLGPCNGFSGRRQASHGYLNTTHKNARNGTSGRANLNAPASFW